MTFGRSVLVFSTVYLLIAGCSVIDVRAKIDPAGGAVTESFADVYDFDRDGLWYVVFVREDGLLAAVHRHNPGIHLFLDDQQDILFQCRCSGRGEVINIMGQTFSLSKGTVFLCEMETGTARTRQLPLTAPKCDGNDPEARAKAIFETSLNPEIAAFLSDATRARLAAQWKISASKKLNNESPARLK